MEVSLDADSKVGWEGYSNLRCLHRDWKVHKYLDNFIGPLLPQDDSRGHINISHKSLEVRETRV